MMLLEVPDLGNVKIGAACGIPPTLRPEREEWGTHFVGCVRVIERPGHPPTGSTEKTRRGRQHRSRPCTKRKDGAPIVSKRETAKNQKRGPPVLAGGKAVVKEALQCAANCGAKAAFDEYNHPSPHATAPHLYVQTVPTQTGGSGALPSAEPEN